MCWNDDAKGRNRSVRAHIKYIKWIDSLHFYRKRVFRLLVPILTGVFDIYQCQMICFVTGSCRTFTQIRMPIVNYASFAKLFSPLLKFSFGKCVHTELVFCVFFSLFFRLPRSSHINKFRLQTLKMQNCAFQIIWESSKLKNLLQFSSWMQIFGQISSRKVNKFIEITIF